MYKVIEAKGFQHKVVLGETLKVPKVSAEVGSDLVFPNVLMSVKGEDIQVGTPYIETEQVKAEVLAHCKDHKVKVFKKERRKAYRRTQGHRQQYTEVIIKEFVSPDSNESVDEKVLIRARARVKAIANLKTDALPKKALSKLEQNSLPEKDPKKENEGE